MVVVRIARTQHGVLKTSKSCCPVGNPGRSPQSSKCLEKNITTSKKSWDLDASKFSGQQKDALKGSPLKNLFVHLVHLRKVGDIPRHHGGSLKKKMRRHG